jgi:hypothetical protein
MSLSTKMAAKFEPEGQQEKDPEIRQWAARQVPVFQGAPADGPKHSPEPDCLSLSIFRSSSEPEVIYGLHVLRCAMICLLVADRIGREGRGVFPGYCGAQPFSRLADRKRKGFVLLDLTKMFHRISAPSSVRQTL